MALRKLKQDIDLTKEEIWDDTALVEALDSAVDQYKVNHNSSRFLGTKSLIIGNSLTISTNL